MLDVHVIVLVSLCGLCSEASVEDVVACSLNAPFAIVGSPPEHGVQAEDGLDVVESLLTRRSFGRFQKTIRIALSSPLKYHKTFAGIASCQGKNITFAPICRGFHTKRESDVLGCCCWFTYPCCLPLRFTNMVRRGQLMPKLIVPIVPIMSIMTVIFSLSNIPCTTVCSANGKARPVLSPPLCCGQPLSCFSMSFSVPSAPLSFAGRMM